MLFYRQGKLVSVFTCNMFHKISFIGKVNQRVYMQIIRFTKLATITSCSISREESR